MSDKTNPFRRQRDLLSEAITKQVGATEKAFGTGGTPYGKVRLRPQEKQEYWKSLSIDQKAAKWAEMTAEEQQQFKQEMSGAYGE